jgi:hypothetical protein
MVEDIEIIEETRIQSLIVTVRGQKVILDDDLARIYGVSTKRFNEQVKRNAERFPKDFMFRLSHQEVADLRSQIATSNRSPNRRQSLTAQPGAVGHER